MPDRDKVIDYLQSEIYRAEQSVDDIWLECVEVKLLRDALALLKEQGKALYELGQLLKERAEEIERYRELVRCKDCRWYSEKGFCKHPNGGAGNIRPADWFCADGERKE